MRQLLPQIVRHTVTALWRRVPHFVNGTAPANFIEYNDHSWAESITHFAPALRKLVVYGASYTHPRSAGQYRVHVLDYGWVANSNTGINYTLLFEY